MFLGYDFSYHTTTKIQKKELKLKYFCKNIIHNNTQSVDRQHDFLIISYCIIKIILYICTPNDKNCR